MSLPAWLRAYAHWCRVALIVSSVALLANVAALPGQSPLSTTFAHDNGGAGGGMVFFDLDVLAGGGVTLTGFECNTASSAGELDVYVVAGSYAANANNAGAWTLRASGQLRGAGSGQPTWLCLTPAIQLGQGLHGIAIAGAGVAHHYTVGSPGVPLVYGTAELTLTAGAACNQPFTGAQYAPRIFNGRLHYLPGRVAGLDCARSEVQGRGCIDGAASFYQQFDGLSALDLGGTLAAPMVLTATAAGSLGYAVQLAPGTWFSPTSAPIVGNALAVPLRDDDVSEALVLPFAFPFVGGSTSVVHATSNGYLLLGATSATIADLLPTTAKLLGGPPRLSVLWCDLHASANHASNAISGVHFDVLPGAQQVVVTWLDVGDGRSGTPLPGTTSINVQCVLSANGDFEYRYATMQPGVGIGVVVVGASHGDGIANGPAARDPGNRDLSASAFVTDGPDSFPLVHTTGLARLGAALELAVDGADGLLPLAFVSLGAGAAPPAFDLAGFGAPGCSLGSLLETTVAVPLDAMGRAGAISLSVPAVPTLAGVTLHSQFAALTARNDLGLVTSNSMNCTIGW